jgi:inorganic triphosphatase YgiF
MRAGTEAELKLRAPDEAALDALARLPHLGGAALGPPRSVQETDVYLDTRDGRLAAARWACRLRTRGQRRWVSLKGPPEHLRGEALHLRPELEGPVGDPRRPTGWPDSPARGLLLELAGGAELEERLTLRQRRTERRVSDPVGRVGVLTLDRVEVLAGGRSCGRLLVVELELDPAIEPRRQAALGAELHAALLAQGLRAEPASKLELALDILG